MAEAVVTSGGVCTKEINPKTMESKIKKGLFFAGEVIDVDGYTGGFNLTVAFHWISGRQIFKLVNIFFYLLIKFIKHDF